MYLKKTLLLVLSFFLLQCKKELTKDIAPPIVEQATNRNSYTSPYLGTTAFRSVLDISMLQRNNTTIARPPQLQDGYADRNFYLKNGQYMRFEAEGKKGRSEVRCLEEWDAADNAEKSFSALVKLFTPPSGVKEVTFAQIHAKTSSFGKPFLRIAYYKSRSGKSKHIWAVIKKEDSDGGDYLKIDLGPLAANHASLNIKVVNKKLYVTYNGKKMPSHRIHSSWYNTNMHFKAGVYVQTDGGRCKVEYKKLNYKLPSINNGESEDADNGNGNNDNNNNDTNTNDNTIKKFFIPTSNVSANRHDGNAPANTLDGKLSTRWSAEGVGSYITFDLGVVKTVSKVKIAWYKGNTRKAYFVIRTGESKYNLSTVYDGRGSGSSSGSSLQLETFDLGNITTRYVRINGFGNSARNNDWNSITEVEVWGTDTSNSNAGGSGDNGGSTNNNTPFNVCDLQDEWKCTFPKDGDRDDRADEIFLDASKNDVRSDGSLRDYENQRYFYTDGTWTYFKCQGNGATTGGSSNPRTELRQMEPGGSTQSNWDMTRSTPQTMEMTLRIMQTSVTRKLAFAQIHAQSGSKWDDILRIQIQSDKPNARVGDKGHIYIMGSGNDDGHDTILNNYTLGDVLNVKIVAKNSRYEVYLNNRKVFTSDSNIDSRGNYFKAGCYLQSVKSAGTSGEGIVGFKKIRVY